MARYTLTNTSWGELRVLFTAEGREVRASCKACGVTTTQLIGEDVNPFAITPAHNKGCRFDRPGQPTFVREGAEVRLPSPQQTAQLLRPPTVAPSYWVVGAAGGAVLGVIELVRWLL